MKIPAKPYQVELYKTIKDISNILSQKKTIDILFYLSHEPMRYNQLKKLTGCKDNTLSRRLHSLMEYNIVGELTVIMGNKKTHEYTITDLGQELIKFYRIYERKIRKYKGNEGV